MYRSLIFGTLSIYDLSLEMTGFEIPGCVLTAALTKAGAGTVAVAGTAVVAGAVDGAVGIPRDLAAILLHAKILLIL